MNKKYWLLTIGNDIPNDVCISFVKEDGKLKLYFERIGKSKNWLSEVFSNVASSSDAKAKSTVKIVSIDLTKEIAGHDAPDKISFASSIYIVLTLKTCILTRSNMLRLDVGFHQPKGRSYTNIV